MGTLDLVLFVVLLFAVGWLIWAALRGVWRAIRRAYWRYQLGRSYQRLQKQLWEDHRKC